MTDEERETGTGHPEPLRATELVTSQAISDTGALPGLVVLDADNVVLHWSRQVEELYGWTAEQAVGCSIFDLPLRITDRELAATLKARSAALQEWEGAITVRRSDGTSLEVWARIIPIADGDGKAVVSISQLAPTLESRRAKRIGGILESVSDAFFALDAQWRFIYVNREAERIIGRNRRELIGRSIWDEVPEPVGLLVRGQLERATDTDTAVEFEALHPTLGIWLEIRVYPSADGVAVSLRDVSLRRAAQSAANSAQTRLAFLARVTSVLDASLDYERAIRQLAELCVPYLGDNCLVDIVDTALGIRQVAVTATNPDTVAVMEELRQRYTATNERPNPAQRVINSGRGELFVHMGDSIWQAIAQDAEHLRLLRAVGVTSGVTAPLSARGRVYGAISVGSIESGRVFGPTDLAFLEELGRRAGLAIDNARLYSQLASTNRKLQELLLPPDLPPIEGVTTAARYLAAGDNEVGGDFYDLFVAIDGTWVALVGDVQGKGATAAGMTGLARHTLRAVALHERAPAAVLSDLNRALMASDHADSFLTLAYLRLQPSGHGIATRMALGGHPPPFIVRANGSVEQVGRPGPLLGVFDEVACPEVMCHLGPADAIVLYTDGVTERRSGHQFLGEDGLATLLAGYGAAPADEIAEAVREAVENFDSTPPRDDMAVLVLRVDD